jgi:hypothetical protein
MTDRPSDRAIAQAVLAFEASGVNDLSCREVVAWIKLYASGKDAAAPEGAQAVAWQVRRADPFGKGFGWEFVTRDAFELTKQSGRYYGFDDGMACEVRALYTAAPPLGGEDGAKDREDAARYRWLRSPDRAPGACDLWVAMGSFGTGIGQWNGKLLDDVVDAARAAGGEGS